MGVLGVQREGKQRMKQIELRPKGVVLVQEKTLSLSAFRSRRTRVEGEILRLQQENREIEAQHKSNIKRIQQLEQTLMTFNSPEVLEWERNTQSKLELAKEKRRLDKIEANNRAKAFLREFLGQETYDNLMKRGSLEFQGTDGRAYSISKNGQLYRGNKRLCMIRPRNLPLPDYIASVLTTMKEVGRRT